MLQPRGILFGLLVFFLPGTACTVGSAKNFPAFCAFVSFTHTLILPLLSKFLTEAVSKRFVLPAPPPAVRGTSKHAGEKAASALWNAQPLTPGRFTTEILNFLKTSCLFGKFKGDFFFAFFFFHFHLELNAVVADT
jgi:hypothetical protein